MRVRITKWSFRLLGGREELKSGLEQLDRCTGDCEKRYGSPQDLSNAGLA